MLICLHCIYVQFFPLPSVWSYFELKYISGKVRENFINYINEVKISATWSKHRKKKHNSILHH